MGTTTTPESGGRGFVSSVPGFFRASWEELKKVTWPDRPQTVDATWRIILFVLAIGAVIGLLDLLLQLILVNWIPSIFSGR